MSTAKSPLLSYETERLASAETCLYNISIYKHVYMKSVTEK